MVVLSIIGVVAGGICLYVLINKKVTDMKSDIAKLDTKINECIKGMEDNNNLDMSKIHKGHLKIDGDISCTGNITGFDKEVR